MSHNIICKRCGMKMQATNMKQYKILYCGGDHDEYYDTSELERLWCGEG
jgi:hypothetical protein